jgi:hypothetical protein
MFCDQRTPPETRACYSTAGLPAAVKKARRRDAIFSAAAAGTQAAALDQNDPKRIYDM